MTAHVLALVFWTSSALLAYHYVLFPLGVFALAKVRPRACHIDPAFRPTVSIVIAAFNEQSTIAAKIEDTLRLDYPRDLLDIIVAADGSSDGTVRIASSYAGRGVQVLHQPQRQGKTAALNRAIPHCTGEIVLFSDANTEYSRNALQSLVRHFADPTVGGVSGRKVVIEDTDRPTTRGETVYWSFEALLKQWESAAGSVVTADGEIFAMRRSLFPTIDRSIVHDDMYLTLKVVQAGFRVLYEPLATSAERSSKSVRDEFHLKVRYASAGYQIMAEFPRLFVPPTWFGLEFVSHKLLRWLAPFFFIAVLVTSGLLTGLGYTVVFAAQLAFYLVAAAGWLLPKAPGSNPLSLPFYFCAMNAAALFGFARYFVAGQTPLWRKAER